MLRLLVRQFTTSGPAMAAATTATATGTNYWVLQYNYVPNVLEKRAPFRQAHFDYLKEYVNNGSLMLGGALANPVDAAIIIFQNVTKETVEGFAKNDPYVLNGIATTYGIREWTVVVGAALKSN